MGKSKNMAAAGNSSSDRIRVPGASKEITGIRIMEGVAE